MSASPPEIRPAAISRGLESYEPSGLSVQDINRLRDASLRRAVTYAIVGAFLFVNVLTTLGIGWIYSNDQAELARHLITPADRIITTSIVVTAVGATTVQLGALALLIGRFLFPATDVSIPDA